MSIESSREEEAPLTPMTESYSNRDSFPSSIARDSIITNSTDIDTSIIPSESDLNFVNYVEEKQNNRSLVHGTTSPFYHRKRFWAICVAVSVILSAIFIPLLFLVIIPTVAQSSVNQSKMAFKYINITQPTNDSFVVSMLGEASGTGPFDAKITFNGPIEIIYDNHIIGTSELDTLSVSGGKGDITGLSKTFIIKDKPRLTEFSSKVMLVESFKWIIQGSANVHALGTNTNNLKLYKEVEISGSNGFITSLEELSVTQNPDKSLNLKAKTNIFNPSPIGIELGTMIIQLRCDQTIITNATVSNVFIIAGNNTLNIDGVSSPPVTDYDKSNFQKIMNAYLTNKPLNTTAKILSVLPKSGVPVDWLSSATENLTLTTTIGNQVKPPQIVKGVSFGQTYLKFTPDAPYSPTLSSKNSSGNYDLPFKVDFKIKTLQQKLIVSYKNKPIATVETPEIPANNTDTTMTFDIGETQMKVINGSESLFSDLLTSLTVNDESEVVISGETNIKAFTSLLGDVQIQGLPLNVSTNFQGFEQFNGNGTPPSISNINLLAGTPKQLIMSATVTLVNTSPNSLSVGKVTLDVFYKEQKIGSTIIPDLSISPGPNPLNVFTTLDDPLNNSGLDLLTSFLTGQEVAINIRGTDNSTNIVSLVPAFKSINISSTIPPLGDKLFSSSKIVFDNQSGATNTSIGVVDVVNRFNTPISIYTMSSSFSIGGNVVGTLEQDLRNNPIFIPGNSVQNLKLPVKMSLDPSIVFSTTRNLAKQNGLDVSVFDLLMVLSKVNIPGVDPNVQPTPEAIKSFDLAKFLTTSLAKIPSTVDLKSEVAVGEYFMPMAYKQDVIATTDESVLQLVPMFATPLVNQLMGQAQIEFDSVFIKDIDVNTFDIFVTAQIPNTGPLPAQISFPNGIYVGAENIVLGTLFSPPILAEPAGGAKINNVGKFVIADIPSFTTFSANAFKASSVTWYISSDATVTSFGLPIPITIKKSFPMDGFSGMQQYTTNSSVETVNGGIGVKTIVEMNNPSIVGIELGLLTLNVFIGNNKISTISGNVVINPKSTSTIIFEGPLTLDPTTVSSMITGNTNNATITIQGVSITPPKATGPVEWLNTIIQNFVINLPFDPKALLGGGAQAAPPPAAPAAPPASQT